MAASRHFVDVQAWDPSSPEWRRLLHLLPAHEQQQVTRFVFGKDQNLALASRLMQRQIIHELFGEDYGAIEISRTPENKPFWKRPSARAPTWNYNVSHHGTMVALASASRALVGVDVVRISDRPRRKTSIEDFFRAFIDHFNASEWRYIRGEDEDEQYTRFYRLWSLKEAYIKAVGVGLGFSLLRAELVPADSTREEQWELFLDGQPARDWKFVSTQINDTHLVSVAQGPFSALWKPETSSIFPCEVLPTASIDEEPVAWQEWTVQDLLQ